MSNDWTQEEVDAAINTATQLSNLIETISDAVAKIRGTGNYGHFISYEIYSGRVEASYVERYEGGGSITFPLEYLWSSDPLAAERLAIEERERKAFEVKQAKIAADLSLHEAQERAQYEKLKAKYEPSPSQLALDVQSAFAQAVKERDKHND